MEACLLWSITRHDGSDHEKRRAVAPALKRLTPSCPQRRAVSALALLVDSAGGPSLVPGSVGRGQ